ncbi:MAG TPA: hypothetical protein PKE57_12905 [Cellvibrionaceae bacterium]|nr:hypothetical protein [Cellvibrionaceae bacterium]HMW48879.1 hypothetical protein [Cellvibrionaceae bacterium]HMW73287.1 hypothetical protein [Cellvibrionaceae bacterium]HMY38614.1 hypothetical protein [Marinagarivorans sp.]HNG61487.1 hypothetical protein [Cellvibrionaceae bacterium]
MLKFFCISLSILLALDSAGCSSQRGFNAPDLQFKTLITADHIKRFELTLIPKPAQLDPLSSRRGLEEAPSERQLKGLLKDTLASNGFCKAGFLPLGRYAGESHSRLRGECKDAATPEDIAKFPNTIERW